MRISTWVAVTLLSSSLD